ncbi:MAG: VanW family protein [Oscillospiraceae bacterium]|nr:VanW family protein [Oscillospiraceae bacterium]
MGRHERKDYPDDRWDQEQEQDWDESQDWEDKTSRRRGGFVRIKPERSDRGEYQEDYKTDYDQYGADAEDGYDEEYDDYEDWYGGHGGSGRKRWLIPVIVVAVLLVAVLGGGMAWASSVVNSDTIYPNISVNGIDVGGLTVAEAAQVLEEQGANPYQDTSVTVNFSTGDTLVVTAEDLGLDGDVQAPAEMAYAYGRSDGLLSNFQTYLACRSDSVALTWSANTALDEEALAEMVAQAAQSVNTQLLETEYTVGTDTITIIKGGSAVTVDEEALCTAIKEAFVSQTYDDIDYTPEASGDGESDEEVDALLQAIYDAVYVEPVNAEYDSETGGATESVTGVSFDLDAAKALYQAAETGESVVITLIYTEPDITSAVLEENLFVDLLSEKTTSLSGSSSARINNITLAAEAMNDTVINPGEEFSYNDCLGERTAAKGYQSAGAYENGQHVSSIGGGICQGSSTLYYCALYANLEITVRSCHYFTVSYLPRGLDATVSWGGPEFKFVNSRNYPIQIKAWVSNGSLTVQLWGTDEDGSYVEITSSTWEDSSYYYAQTYRAVYDADGNQISYEKEAYSSYHKESSSTATETPEPTETAEPTASPPDTAATDTPTETETPSETETPAATDTATPVETETPAETVTPSDTGSGTDDDSGSSGDDTGSSGDDGSSTGDDSGTTDTSTDTSSDTTTDTSTDTSTDVGTDTTSDTELTAVA